MVDPLAETGGEGKGVRDLGGGFALDLDTGVVLLNGFPVHNAVYQQWLAQQQQFERELRQTPTSSSSSNVSQSVMDPNAIALQQEELRLRQRELDARAANDRVQDQFARDKLALDTRLGNAADVRAGQALLEQIAARQAQNELSRVQIMQDSANLQANLDFQAAQANARAQMDAAQINELRRQSNLEQRRGVAQDIASFSKQPGDIGALAAYQFAGGADPSAFSRAIAEGKDFRTPESLLPLDLLLGTRNELAQGPALFQPTMVNAPRVAMPQFGALPAGVVPPGAPRPAVPLPSLPQPVVAPQAAPDAGGFVDPNSDQYQNDGWYAPGAEQQALFTQDKEPGGSYGIQEALEILQREASGMSQGGMTRDRMFFGNEKGAELFINPTGAPIAVVDAKMTKKIKGHAAGTLFQGEAPEPILPAQNPTVPFLNERPAVSSWEPSAQISLPSFGISSRGRTGAPAGVTGARYSGLGMQTETTNPASVTTAQYSQPQSASLQFLNDAYQMAARRTPWARNAPTPVGVSAPGTSPFTQQVAAALAALQFGVHPSLFFEEAARAAPVGLSGAPMRRTR